MYFVCTVQHAQAHKEEVGLKHDKRIHQTVSRSVCVCVSKTNIKLDSLHPQKLEETSTDGFVLNMLRELDLCRHMCSPIH